MIDPKSQSAVCSQESGNANWRLRSLLSQYLGHFLDGLIYIVWYMLMEVVTVM